MASIDIGKLVQESVMTAGETTQTSEIVQENLDIDSLTDKLEEAYLSVSQMKKAGKFGPAAGAVAGGLRAKNATVNTAKSTAGGAKKAAGTTAAKVGGGAALAAGAVYKGMKDKMQTQQKHAEALRSAAKQKIASQAEKLQSQSGVAGSLKHAGSTLKKAGKEKLADAQSRAGGMGAHLKAIGNHAMDKIKENPKAAVGIAAGTAGAVGAGLAAKKLMAMRKVKKAA